MHACINESLQYDSPHIPKHGSLLHREPQHVCTQGSRVISAPIIKQYRSLSRSGGASNDRASFVDTVHGVRSSVLRAVRSLHALNRVGSQAVSPRGSPAPFAYMFGRRALRPSFRQVSPLT